MVAENSEKTPNASQEPQRPAKESQESQTAFQPPADPAPASRPEAHPARDYGEIDDEIDAAYRRNYPRVEDIPSGIQWSKLSPAGKLQLIGIVLAAVTAMALIVALILNASPSRADANAPVKVHRIEAADPEAPPLPRRKVERADATPEPDGWLPNKARRVWRILFYPPDGKSIRFWVATDWKIHPNGWVELIDQKGAHHYVRNAEIIEPLPKTEPDDAEFVPVPKRFDRGPPRDPPPFEDPPREPVPDPNK